MEKPYHKIVMLVLSSHNAEVYRRFRKVYQEYYDSNPNVKLFMVYGRSEDLVKREHDLVYQDIEENYYPGMIKKTLRAMDHIDKNFEYDFMIRTNISTFWDFDRFVKRIDRMPKKNCFTGTLRNCFFEGKKTHEFISGVNLIMSRDIVKHLVRHAQEVINIDLPEDIALSKYFVDKGMVLKPTVPGPIHFMDKFSDFDEGEVLREIALARKMNHDHFRIKNKNREDVDIAVANTLLREYYGKTTL
jgi:hypothetical protein